MTTKTQLIKDQRLVDRRGFTLIELVVVIGIMLMLTGLAVTTFTRARDKDLAFGEARQVSDFVLTVLRRASAVQKPASCANTTLDKYQVKFVSDTVIQAWAICQGNDAMTDALTLSHGTVTTPPPGTNLDFSTLYGGVSATTIEVCSAHYQFKIDVGSGGSVSEPQSDGSC